MFWSVSIIIGFQMFLRDKGLAWERTTKVDANHDLVRVRVEPRTIMQPVRYDIFLLQGVIQLDVLAGVSRQRHRRETSRHGR